MKKTIVALTGGVGGAKLAIGLAQTLPTDELAIVVNTGDDFRHLGLSISPDIDTLVYTLAGVNNPETGWGRKNETWSFMTALEELGGESWFRLGDKDLAQNILRSAALQQGNLLSDITAKLSGNLGVGIPIVPMTDDTVQTIIETPDGTLDFQDYFVRQQCRPIISAIRYRGNAEARPAPLFAQYLQGNNVAAFLICPSNPYLSIDPILSLYGVRNALRENNAPVIAVSPVVAGKSLKGPTAKIMSELGVECSALEIARHYSGLIDMLVIDASDEALRPSIEACGMKVLISETVMQNNQQRCQLAGVVVDVIHDCSTWLT
jgi:LPPG:FO 2-phospho-L-lactate transferase